MRGRVGNSGATPISFCLEWGGEVLNLTFKENVSVMCNMQYAQ